MSPDLQSFGQSLVAAETDKILDLNRAFAAGEIDAGTLADRILECLNRQDAIRSLVAQAEQTTPDLLCPRHPSEIRADLYSTMTGVMDGEISPTEAEQIRRKSKVELHEAHADLERFNHAAPIPATQSTQAPRPTPPALPAEPALPIPNPGIIKRSPDNRFGDLCDAYLRDYKGRDTTRHARTEYWKERLGNLTISQLDDDVIRDELDHLATRPALSFHGRDAHGNAIHKTRGKALSGSTLNRYRAALSAILTWAQKKGITPKNYVHPCTAVPLQEEGKPRLRYLTSEEITRLLDACRNSRWAALWLIVRLALTTGARRGELVSLTWEAIDLDRGTASLAETKNGDRRTLILLPDVVDELKGFKRVSCTGLVFASPKNPKRPFQFEKIWQEALAEAKIKGFVFHGLRHTAASHLAMAGASLTEVGDLLGHRTLAMTRRYSHLSTSHKAELVNRVFSDLR